MAEQRKETSNSKGFVTVPDDLKIQRMSVEEKGKEGNSGVDGYHEEYSDNAEK